MSNNYKWPENINDRSDLTLEARGLAGWKHYSTKPTNCLGNHFGLRRRVSKQLYRIRAMFPNNDCVSWSLDQHFQSRRNIEKKYYVWSTRTRYATNTYHTFLFPRNISILSTGHSLGGQKGMCSVRTAILRVLLK